MLNFKIQPKKCLIKAYNLIQLHATCHTNIIDKAAAQYKKNSFGKCILYQKNWIAILLTKLGLRTKLDVVVLTFLLCCSKAAWSNFYWHSFCPAGKEDSTYICVSIENKTLLVICNKNIQKLYHFHCFILKKIPWWQLFWLLTILSSSTICEKNIIHKKNKEQHERSKFSLLFSIRNN